MFKTLLALATVALPPASQSATLPPEIDLVEEFRAVCLDWDGDPGIAVDVAQERGYLPYEDALPPQARRFRFYATMNVWSKVENGVRAQVLTNGSWIGGQEGEGHFEQCSAIVSHNDFRATRTIVRDLTGLDWFQQDETSVFAWIETPEGRRHVRRNRFDLLILLRREPGLRVITVARNDDGVVLSYLKPRGSSERFSFFSPSSR